MTHWFAYTIAASSLVGLACWLLEAGAWRRGWGTRRAWLAGMFGAVCMPLLAWNGLAGVWPGGLLETVRPASLGLVGEALGAAPALPSGLLASAWLAASAVLFLSLAAGLAAGAWRTRRWRETMLDGTPVRVSESVGPAVVGVLRPTIVVPRWVLGAPAAERAMILRHESEHVRAGDPRLLLVGRVLVALMPWNLPLWWMARRLRLAVEVDCDRRVLRHARPDVRAYGALLLSVGRHRPGWVGALAGLARPRSMLEHRLRRMSDDPEGRRAGVGGLLAGLAAALLLTAVALPAPSPEAARAPGPGAWGVAGRGCDGAKPAPTVPVMGPGGGWST